VLVTLLPVLFLYIAVILIILLPVKYFILAIKKALDRCTPENRAMTPSRAWLMVIPLANIFVVINVAKSLGAELQRRGIAEVAEPSKKLGLIMCIFYVIIIPIFRRSCLADWFNWIYRAFFFQDFSVADVSSYSVGLFLATLVCWIFWISYWVKIARFSAKIAA
jgi:hypothetical protein